MKIKNITGYGEGRKGEDVVEMMSGKYELHREDAIRNKTKLTVKVDGWVVDPT